MYFWESWKHSHSTYKLQLLLHVHGILGLRDMPNSNPRVLKSFLKNGIVFAYELYLPITNNLQVTYDME